MTIKQLQTIDQIKAWAFPALLGITVFFLKHIIDQIDVMTNKLIDLNTTQEVIKQQVLNQGEDIRALQIDVKQQRSAK